MTEFTDTDLLNAVSIQEVGRLLGFRLPRRGKTHCPFRDHDDSTPSFQIWDKDNRWTCFGCGRHGGAIDLVKEYLGIDFREAKRWLAVRTRVVSNLDRPVSTSRTTRSHIAAPTLRKDEGVESPPDHELYEALLERSPLLLSGHEYLTGRKLSRKVFSAFKIGQMSDSRNTIGSLIQKYGYIRVAAAGLLTTQSTTQRWSPTFPDGSILFPFIEGDTFAYIQARLLPPSNSSAKWRNLSRRRQRIYNVIALHKMLRKPFAICEGVIDTLSAVELGYSPVGLMGVGASLSENELKRLRNRHVTILLDWDPPGEAKATTLQAILRRFGISSTRKMCPLPKVKDLNDYLMATK